MIPYPYQRDCLDATERAFAEFDRVLDVLPTGAGKTCIFAWLAQQRRERGERTLILAHRDELIDQAIAKLHKAAGVVAEKEKAESHASLSAMVVVASVQTMIRRLDKWPRDHFSLIVCDEAHHALSDIWQQILGHFDAQVLGVTATPERGDQRNLGQFFETKGYEISLRDLIQQGYLSPIRFHNLPLQIDLSGVDSAKDPEFGLQDFNRNQMAVRLESYLPKFAHCLAVHASFRRTLVFAPLVQTAMKGAAACNAVGLSAEFVHGEDPERKAKLEAFRNFDFEILWNADLLKEGYDDPGIDCIAPFRPTRVKAMYWQWVGRGTRLANGKQDLLVLDCLYMNQKHPVADVFTLVAKDEFEAEQMRELAGAGKGLPADVAVGCEQDLVGLQIEAENQRERALVKRLEQVKANDSKLITPEEFAILHRSIAVAEHQDVMPSDSLGVTEKQMKWLKKVRIHPQNGSVFLRGAPRIAKPLDVSQIKTLGQASKILSVCFDDRNRGIAMATEGQKRVMRRMGFPDAERATADQARRFFAGLRKPKEEELAL